MSILYLRSELNNFEYRTPIIPDDINKLINNGFIVFVESSKYRIYKDDDYKKAGAIITNNKWYDSIFNNALIVGLKEIDLLDKLSSHIHIYFSHSYKKQNNSQEILKHFFDSSSIIYDFEYFVNNNNKRLLSFGFYAGIVGGILGLLQYYTKNIYDSNICRLKGWISENNMMEDINNSVKEYLLLKKIKIAIIGYSGNCGKGVINILNKLNISYKGIGKYDNKTNLKEYDIIYNCINLDENYNEIWFSDNTIFNKNIVICDVSCDYAKPNNPIKLYNQNTTWNLPVYSYNEFVDIIAINNLPSLLPKDSSDYFSEKCTELLLNFNNDENGYWKNNLNIFYDKIHFLNNK